MQAVGCSCLPTTVRRADAIRRPGAGRKAAKTLDPGLVDALQSLVEPVTRGDPESPLRWTSKSLRRLSEELRTQGYQASHTLVGQLLHEAGYSLQANRKTREGVNHPDRNAQFEHINRRVKQQLKRGGPAISVDTKKKHDACVVGGRFQEWWSRMASQGQAGRGARA